MIKQIISSLCIVLGGVLAAQDSLAVKYAETIKAEELSKHLHIISADDYEGRESGYAGQRKCEEYMVDFYKELGLPPVKGSYTQEFELSLDDPQKVYVSQGENQFTFLEDYYYFPSTSDRKLSGELVFAGYGIDDPLYSDLDISSIKGKVVVSGMVSQKERVESML